MRFVRSGALWLAIELNLLDLAPGDGPKEPIGLQVRSINQGVVCDEQVAAVPVEAFVDFGMSKIG